MSEGSELTADHRANGRLIAARLGFGAILLILPARAFDGLSSRRPDRLTHALVRLLGARHLIEACLLRAHPKRRWARAGAAVDAIHALTMLGVATLDPRRRRLALTSALVATVWALLAGRGTR